MNKRFRHVVLALGVLLALTGAAAGIQAIGHHGDNVAAAQAETRAEFWRTVEGSGSMSDKPVANKLAKELNELSKDEVADFRGNTSAYGGLDAEIEDYDMFASQENGDRLGGPLTSEVQTYVIQIKNGELEAVLDADAAPAPGGYTLTPAGIGVVPTAAGLVVLAGSYLFAGAVYDRRREERVRTEMAATYGGCVDELEAIRRSLAAAHPTTDADHAELARIRAEVEAAFSTMRAGLAPELTTPDVSPAVADLRNQLGNLTEGIAVRHEVYRELNKGQTTT